MKHSQRPTDLLEPLVTDEVEADIAKTYRYLRRRALIGVLSPQAGTIFEQRSAWLSCMDLVSHDRDESSPPDNIPPWAPSAWDDPLLGAIDDLDTADDENLLDAIALSLEVLKRSRRLLLLPKGEADSWRQSKVFAYHYNDDKAQALIAKADAGDIIAADTLRSIARDFLVAGMAPPPHLTTFVLLGLYGFGVYDGPHTGARPGRKRRKKEDKVYYRQRDLELAKAVGDVVRRGYKPYRARYPKGRPKPNAQWIVWKACERLGLPVGLRDVEECWRLHHARAAEIYADKDGAAVETEIVTLDGEILWSSTDLDELTSATPENSPKFST